MWRWLFRLSPEQARQVMSSVSLVDVQLYTFVQGDSQGKQDIVGFEAMSSVYDVSQGRPTEDICRLFANVSCGET